MGSTPVDRVVHQLRGDVDGLYELANNTNREVKSTNGLARGVDQRLRRLEKTSGRQFGLLLVTQRQHGHRLEGMESGFGDVGTAMSRHSEILDETVSRLATLEVVVGGVAGRTNVLTDRVDGLSGRIDGLTGQMDGLTEGVDGLAGRVDGLTERVGGLTGRVDGLTERFDGLTARVDGLTGQVDGLTERVDGLAEQVDGLTGRVDDLTEKVDGLIVRVSRLEDQMVQLTAAVHQNSVTLDLVVELLRKQQFVPHEVDGVAGG
ncbi:hypothetical protein [Nocardia suismassiliense]|uniref:hypothetical protein n=1 Tax=Nocardia suismassiliense TaxID=2077092 RepID=UPI00131EEB73|nr:hypothetical protein [Nocardia suismassiliense]